MPDDTNYEDEPAVGMTIAIKHPHDGRLSYDLFSAELTHDDFKAVRKTTGFTLNEYLARDGDAMGMDGFLAILWIAARKAGNRRLSYQGLIAAYPTIVDFNAAEPSLEPIYDADADADVEVDPTEGATTPSV